MIQSSEVNLFIHIFIAVNNNENIYRTTNLSALNNAEQTLRLFSLKPKLTELYFNVHFIIEKQ